MGLEIERKFLIVSEIFKDLAQRKTRIRQGYLTRDIKRNVRVRITDQCGFITIKGQSNATGTSRFEWEKEITVTEAEDLLKLSEGAIIDKTRYYIHYENHTFEVDEFYGDNDGLIVAEVELKDENEFFEKPDWLGKEVTGDAKYYNASLVDDPFKNWSL